jgi:hypothetical protein
MRTVPGSEWKVPLKRRPCRLKRNGRKLEDASGAFGEFVRSRQSRAANAFSVDEARPVDIRRRPDLAWLEVVVTEKRETR